MILLIDDQLLGTVLRDRRPPFHTGEDPSLYTTGYWYVRLCQAVLGANDRGVLSTRFAHLPEELRHQALASLLDLPQEIGLVSLRELAPVIGRLRRHHQLNILGMEALAAAVHLGAEVVLSVRSPRLEVALAAEGRACRYST